VHLTAEVMVWARNRLSCLIELHITARLHQHFRYIRRPLPIHMQPLEVQSSLSARYFCVCITTKARICYYPWTPLQHIASQYFQPPPRAARQDIVSSFVYVHRFVYVGAYTFALDQRKAARWRPHLLDLRFVVGYPEEVVKQHICSEEHRGDVATWPLRVFEGKEVGGDELDGWRAKK
jgi:hypothetical protein